MDETLKVNDQASETRRRRTFEPPTLTFVGTIREVVQSGGGKLSLVGGDPGESRKQTPAG